MVKIPQGDPTVLALDKAMVSNQSTFRRKYLGMSGIGEECQRKLWYDFHFVLQPEKFEALTLRRFDDGHRTEDLIAKHLRAIKGVTLITANPETGRQIGYTDFGGHFRGHIDGHIEGVLSAPKTPHIWEHKATNDKKFKGLVGLRAKNEKTALIQWDTTYYSQAVLYMEYGGYSRHFLTCSTAGGRELTGVRTDADPVTAARLKSRARRIITSNAPLDRLSDDKTFYKCGWCRFNAVCHEGAAPDRDCRTCAHATANIETGVWDCAKHGCEATEVCTSHRFLPSLIPGEPTSANEAENWIEYKMKNGSTWRDVG